jgi:hypothetical protein
VLQVEEEARRAIAGAGKVAGGVALSGVAGATWRGEEGPAKAGRRCARRWRARGAGLSGAGAAGAWENSQQAVLGCREKTERGRGWR